MKLKIEAGKLSEVLKRAKPFVGDQRADNRFRFVELSASKKGVEVRAYDSICFFKSRVEADITEEGKVAVEFGTLFAVLGSFAADAIMSLSSADKFVTLQSSGGGEKNVSKISTAPEWFDYPVVKLSKMAELTAEEFRDIVKRTLVATSLDAFQSLFQGMNFYFEKGRLTVTATNYKMIVQGVFEDKRFKGLDFSFTVGGKQLESLMKAMGDDSAVKFGKVKTGKNEQIYFKTDSISVLMVMLPEKDPDGKTFLSLMGKAKEKMESKKAKKQVFEFDRERLSTILSVLRTIDEKNKLVSVKNDGDKMILKGEQDAKGVVEHTFTIGKKLDGFEFLVNGETMQQIIDAVFYTEDIVRFTFRDSILALEVTGDGSKEFECLFPPIRI